MKWKVTTVVLAAALIFVGCADSGESNAIAKSYFTMNEVEHDWKWNVFEDSETHIQYILYKDSDGHCAITPRYERNDGTLYTSGVKE